GVLLITLLTLPVLAYTVPPFTLGWIHPISLVLLITYGFGLRLLIHIKNTPMWTPVHTTDTQPEISEEINPLTSSRSLWTQFSLCSLVLIVSGYIVGEASIALTQQTPLSETAIGSVFTAFSNS